MVTLAWPMIRLSCTGSLSEWYRRRGGPLHPVLVRAGRAQRQRDLLCVSLGVGGWSDRASTPISREHQDRPTAIGVRWATASPAMVAADSRENGRYELHREASMTDAENVTVARFSVTAE